MTKIHVGYDEQKENPLNNGVFFEHYDIQGHFHSRKYGGFGFIHIDIPNTEESKKELREFVESQIEGKVTRVDEWEQ